MFETVADSVCHVWTLNLCASYPKKNIYNSKDQFSKGPVEGQPSARNNFKCCCKDVHEFIFEMRGTKEVNFRTILLESSEEKYISPIVLL
jgi:hypothetical protein